MFLWPQEYGRFIREEVGSTLDEARQLVRDQAPPFWLMARRQTHGRGRRGRVWHMPDGNFAATLILDGETPPSELALRSFVAAIALRSALVAVTGYEQAFSLKWPNDVLLKDRKVAGILLETFAHESGQNCLAIGIGVNLRKAPNHADLEDGSLAPISLTSGLGVTVTAEMLLDPLAVFYHQYETIFQREGFEPIRDEWLQYAARLGEPIHARCVHRSLKGIFRDIDSQGQLVLDSEVGVVHLPAAEIYF